MKHGHSDTDVTKVVMMGIAGSGKSTALDTIMEEKPLAKEDRDSTPIMKRPVKTMVIVVDGKTKWVKKEQDQFTAHLAATMSTEDSPPPQTAPTDSPLPLHMSTDVSTTPDSSSHPPSSPPPPHSATDTSTTTRSTNRKILSKEECVKIGGSLELDGESLELALEFFHKLSIIFYYPSILPDVVFVDPQVLLDKVTELVQFTFELQDPDFTSAPCLPHGWQQYDKFALVTETFLENEHFSSHYHQPVFTRKHLTTLLEKLLVFARLSPDTWFMPCVLKHLKAEEIRPHCVSRSPLVVHFPDGGPQHGVFCSLIAHVNLHPGSWNIRLADDHPACLYRNCIQFQVSDYAGFVMLIDRYTYFEVHVRTSQRKLHELWQHVRCAIFSGLQSVSMTLGYSNNKPSPAILCPVHTESSHPAPVRDGEWICSTDSARFGDVADLKDCIPYWLEKKQGLLLIHTAIIFFSHALLYLEEGVVRISSRKRRVSPRDESVAGVTG